jgi:hypothetical protein
MLSGSEDSFGQLSMRISLNEVKSPIHSGSVSKSAHNSIWSLQRDLKHRIASGKVLRPLRRQSWRHSIEERYWILCHP